MWQVSGRPISASEFSPFQPDEVLYDFDGPRTFTLKDQNGELHLAHWCDEDSDTTRYVVVPFSPALVQRLKSGNLTLRDAIDQVRVYTVDVSHTGDVIASSRVQIDDLPADALPQPGTMLLPQLEPLISLRAVGQQIKEGRIPSSVVGSLVDGVQHAIKILAEYVLSLPAQAGRPSGVLKRLFDLPAQRMAYGSFEIAFRSPLADEPLLLADMQDENIQAERAAFDRVGELLQTGLNWVTSSSFDEETKVCDNSDEQRVILQAMKNLTPSSQSGIKTLELRGTLVGRTSDPVSLNQDSRRRVNRSLRRLPPAPKQAVEFTGRIRQLDKDKRSFELREINIPGIDMQRFTFDEELAEDVEDAFHENWLVDVVGTPYPIASVAKLAAITKADSSAE